MVRNYSVESQGETVMNKFLERLNGGEILVSDGATGSNLQKMGLRPGQAPEDLIIDNPDILLKLESSFVEAGSDIILTCTFGGTRMRMKDSKYQDRAPEVNSRAVELARKAATASGRTDVLVAGSMGPVGTLLKPYGPLEAGEAQATFAEQAKALSEGGADLLVIETMFSFEETTAAYDGTRAVTDLPIVISFSYDRGTRSMMGVKPKDVMKLYIEKGADVIGANCGTTLENMEAVLKEYSETMPDLPLWAKPNAGIPRMDIETESAIYDMRPEDMAIFAKKYIALGARIVGGCCGSTPEHVAAVAKAVKK
jgi:5-methyltetrahydrofolate--homocysteine methyltransferase